MRYKSIGVTGSRNGMTQPQRDWLLNFLASNTSNVLNHGDCTGVDETVASIFAAKGTYIIAHPGNNSKFRAYSKHNNLEFPFSANLERNRRIVMVSQLMLAFPDEEFEVLRSGTWATVRCAKEFMKPIFVIGPKGHKIPQGKGEK